MSNPTEQQIMKRMVEAENKAIDALSRYKFYMFGYWCAAWVNLNKLLTSKVENPFREYVQLAKRRK